MSLRVKPNSSSPSLGKKVIRTTDVLDLKVTEGNFGADGSAMFFAKVFEDILFVHCDEGIF